MTKETKIFRSNVTLATLHNRRDFSKRFSTLVVPIASSENSLKLCPVASVNWASPAAASLAIPTLSVKIPKVEFVSLVNRALVPKRPPNKSPVGSSNKPGANLVLFIYPLLLKGCIPSLFMWTPVPDSNTWVAKFTGENLCLW